MGTINDFATFAFFLQGYQAVDQAQHTTDSNILYYGFVNNEGAYYIQEQTTSGTTIAWRYDRGNSDFSTAWDARESGSYQRWDKEFV